MIRVRVLPDAHTPHLLQVYAGLTDLARVGAIHLEYFLEPQGDARAFHRGSLWAVVDRGPATSGVKVCLDLFDGGEIASPDGLDRCDLYFKRSYDPGVVAALPAPLRQKLRPLGLNCFLLGDNDGDLLRRVGIEWRLRRARGQSFSRADWSFRAQLIISAMAPRRAPLFVRRRLVPRASAFEAPPDVPRAQTIVLQCRVWSPGDVSHGAAVDQLNDERAALVRLLRTTFAGRFVGGLVDTPFARSRYPDCVTNTATNHIDYLALIQRSGIGVVTRGVHGSIPWKTAEYLAASCCVVTEPMRHVLPEPLEEGAHVLTFITAEECVAHCERLLSNAGQFREMRAANAAYYARAARPARLAERWIGEALDAQTTALHS